VSFFSASDGPPRLFIQPIEGGNAIAVQVAEGRLDSHVWSPDSATVACLILQDSRLTLHVVPPLGGPTRHRISFASLPVRETLVRWIDDWVYVAGGQSVRRVRVPDGSVEDLSGRWSLPGTLRGVDISPDGSAMIHARSENGQEDLWIARLDGTDARRLTSDAFFDRSPIFRGPGTSIVYQSNRGGPIGLWELSLETGRSRPLTSSADTDTPGGSSLDGRFVSFSRESRDATLVAWAMGGSARRLTADALDDATPSLS
jgi:Tol biopolymer transport system component